jgi:hypothetical protein
LLSGSTAFATRGAVDFETWCWDNDASDNTFRCVEGDRTLGTARNLPTPPFDTSDPNAWPLDVTNYVTESHLNDRDQQRCIEIVHSTPGYRDVPESDIWASCGASVDYVLPLGVLTGTSSFGFGDPIERGESRRENGEVEWRGILAQVKSISCSCNAIVDGPD